MHLRTLNAIYVRVWSGVPPRKFVVTIFCSCKFADTGKRCRNLNWRLPHLGLVSNFQFSAKNVNRSHSGRKIRVGPQGLTSEFQVWVPVAKILDQTLTPVAALPLTTSSHSKQLCKPCGQIPRPLHRERFMSRIQESIALLRRTTVVPKQRPTMLESPGTQP